MLNLINLFSFKYLYLLIHSLGASTYSKKPFNNSSNNFSFNLSNCIVFSSMDVCLQNDSNASVRIVKMTSSKLSNTVKSYFSILLINDCSK